MAPAVDKFRKQNQGDQNFYHWGEVIGLDTTVIKL